MRLNTKITLAGIVVTTFIGVININEQVEAKQQILNKDTNNVVYKSANVLNKTNITCKNNQYSFVGK